MRKGWIRVSLGLTGLVCAWITILTEDFPRGNDHFLIYLFALFVRFLPYMLLIGMGLAGIFMVASQEQYRVFPRDPHSKWLCAAELVGACASIAAALFYWFNWHPKLRFFETFVGEIGWFSWFGCAAILLAFHFFSHRKRRNGAYLAAALFLVSCSTFLLPIFLFGYFIIGIASGDIRDYEFVEAILLFLYTILPVLASVWMLQFLRKIGECQFYPQQHRVKIWLILLFGLLPPVGGVWVSRPDIFRDLPFLQNVPNYVYDNIVWVCYPLLPLAIFLALRTYRQKEDEY